MARKVRPVKSGGSAARVEVLTATAAAIGLAGGAVLGPEPGRPERAVAGAVAVGGATYLSYVARVRGKFGLTLEKFARLANVATRTLSTWERADELDESRLRPVRELDRLHDALADLVPADEIGPWLERPNDGFGGGKPMELIERGEADRIWRMVYQLESGTPS